MNLLTSYTGNVNEFEYVVLNFLVFLAQLDRIGNDDAEYDGQLMLFVWLHQWQNNTKV